MVNTKVILFYNTEWQQYHGMAVNYDAKKFNNIGARLPNNHKISLNPPLL
jgi:hypothetical protein